MIRLRLLGPIELTDAGGRELRAILLQPKRLALLACLVVGPRGFRRRDSLLALLWPELDQEHARAALNQAIRFLRRELGDAGSAIISRGADEIGVAPDGLWCDAVEFHDLMENSRYSEALELYRGDLLEGFFGEPGAGFQDWLSRERELLRASASRAARELAAAHERDERYTPAVASARRAVELAEADERTVRELLLLLDRMGDRAGAMQAYDAFAARLAREYEVEPAPETRAVIEGIRSRVAPRSAVALDPAGNGAAPASESSGGRPQGGTTKPVDVGSSRLQVDVPVARRALLIALLVAGGALLGAAATWVALR